jgi:hypothetical protein
MIEVAGHQRNIDVAAFADGFTVVESFQDSEAA